MKATVDTKNALLAILFKNREAIKSYGVKELGLFGSFAVDTKINDTSDVDLMVEFAPGKKSYDNFMELSFYLEEILGSKVELVTHQSLSKYIGPYILKQVEHVSL